MNELKTNKNDLILSAIKALSASIPIIGSIINELIENVIPNQRLARACAFLEKLEKKVQVLENGKIKDNFNHPEFINLLEEAVAQVFKSVSEDRIDHVASILFNSIKGKEIEYDEAKIYLKLLDDVTDKEIIILGSKYYTFRDYPEYHERHQVHLELNTPTLASDNSEIEEYNVYQSYLQHLAVLGLLKQDEKFESQVEYEKIETKRVLGRFMITALGERFLKFIVSQN